MNESLIYTHHNHQSGRTGETKKLNLSNMRTVLFNTVTWTNVRTVLFNTVMLTNRWTTFCNKSVRYQAISFLQRRRRVVCVCSYFLWNSIKSISVYVLLLSLHEGHATTIFKLSNKSFPLFLWIRTILNNKCETQIEQNCHSSCTSHKSQPTKRPHQLH